MPYFTWSDLIAGGVLLALLALTEAAGVPDRVQGLLAGGYLLLVLGWRLLGRR